MSELPFPPFLCLHCLEEFDCPDGEPRGTCPACLAKGHRADQEGWSSGKCEICEREYFAKMADLKARMEARIASEQNRG
jgi:hypothetical protein